ncbi:hypothetical protein J31TS4_41610 [Paenibacillus sp. J31TS4]|uniref:DUF3951 domain-containing protein n=1 Tax=Paenibacillus sp. J31TS4 TaxID=2807195 RepID=UPI001B2204F5|nr:DUF3951 domain-containing protein [Paenibacillus sp. J31TS4]GIP40881.1 hypothetical protein J31TS4_41610 [Paenibacillus sp. J31TS4]
MDYLGLNLSLGLLAPVVLLLAVIVGKLIARKELPDSRYTPVDQLTGQTPLVFQEQKEERKEDGDQGDDEDKHLKR